MRQLQLQRVNQASTVQTDRRPAWRLLDRKIERFTQMVPQPDQSRYRRVQWHAANVGHWIGTLIGCVIGPWALVGIFCFTFGVITGQFTSPDSYAYYSVIAGTFSWVMYSVIISSYQLMRRPVIEHELVRPIWRSEFNQRLMEAPWVMSWPAMLASLTYLIALMLYSNWHLPEDRVSQTMAQLLVPHLFLVLAWPLPMLSTSTLLITVVSEFWRGVLAFSIQFSLFLFVQMFIISRIFNPSASVSLTIATIFMVVGVCILLGTVICWTCQRRLKQMQWGLIAG